MSLGHETSTGRETIGIGGAGNVRSHVNRGVEELEQGHPAYETNVAGRGGEGNIGVGQGHYDVSGGRDQSDLIGRGGAGNVSTTGTYGDPNSVHKVTIADKVIGSAEVAIGKVIHNPALIEKGEERKVEGSLHHASVTPPGSHGTTITEPGASGELKNRAL